MTPPAAAAARPTFRLAAAIAALILLASLAAGAFAAAAASPDHSPAIAPLADRLFARLLQERAAGRDRAALELAYEIVDHHPEFAQADRALLEAVLAARRLGDVALARQLAGELRTRFPRTPLLAQIPKLPGEPAGSEPDTLTLRLIREAESRFPATAPDSATAAGASREAAPRAPRAPGAPAAATAPAAEPALIGVICDAAGDGERSDAVAGARLAVAQAGRLGWRQCRVEPVATAGDAGQAALAVRRLAAAGAIALVADVAPSAALAAAVAADAWGMPLVVLSPDAAELRGLSDWVVPVGLIESREQRLLARLAVATLDRRRAAVLYPDSEEGARAGAEFGRALLDAGGRLVAMAPCRPDAADADEALRVLAAPRPELLYLPFAAATLPRLARALATDPTGALALGRASWCSAPAEAFAAPSLEGTVFPSEAAVWPAAWYEAFGREASAAALTVNHTAASVDAAWRGYAAARLVVAALARCGGFPEREEVASALATEWQRVREAPLTAEELPAAARRIEAGRVNTFNSAPLLR